MSVLEIRVSAAAEGKLEMLQNYCAVRNLEMVPLQIECNAGAIQDEVAAIQNILMSIATDNDISGETRQQLNDFLTEIRLQLQRVASGSPQKNTGTTAARIVSGKAV